MSLTLWAAAPAPTGEAATAQTKVAALPTVQRNCGTVTCSFYFSKRETINLQRQAGTTGLGGTAAASALCGAIGGPAGAICAANVAIQAPRITKNLNDAAKRSGCFVLRYNVLVGSVVAPAHPSAISFGNVASNNQFCKP